MVNSIAFSSLRDNFPIFLTNLVSFVEIRIVTKEVYDDGARNWTDRAGSFLEQSRAFLDNYLGRFNRSNDDERVEDIAADILEECGSGATSGEEVWGTPTSGENDEIQMFNSDQTVRREFVVYFVRYFSDLFTFCLSAFIFSTHFVIFIHFLEFSSFLASF